MAVAIMAAEPVGEQRGSAVIAALEDLYGAIQHRHPDLPDVVLVTGSGYSARRQTWGHFRRDAWREAASAGEAGRAVPVHRRPEMFIAGETLAQGGAHTLMVMLHEAAHGLAAVRGLQDTSKEHRYHNGVFRGLAEELGLVCVARRPDPVHGYNLTELADGTEATYLDVLAELEQAVTLYLDTLERLGLVPGGSPGQGGGDTEGADEPKPEKKPNRNNLKATCDCDRVIRVSRKVLDGAPIICADCEQPFTAEPDE